MKTKQMISPAMQSRMQLMRAQRSMRQSLARKESIRKAAVAETLDLLRYEKPRRGIRMIAAIEAAESGNRLAVRFQDSIRHRLNLESARSRKARKRKQRLVAGRIKG